MQVYCRNACAYLPSCFESVKKAAATIIIELNEVRQDPEGFQRICLVALSILQGINYYSKRTYLPQLVTILDVANSFDFYGFLKIPYHLFHLIDPDKIDEFRTLNALELVLCENWGQGEEAIEGVRQGDPHVHAFAKRCLAELLEQMTVNDLAFVDDERFKNTLQEWLVQEIKSYPDQIPIEWDPNLINLSQLTVVQKEDSWLETWTNLAFIIVDTICVPSFLQEWELIDLGPYAASLGRYRAFSWVPNQSLDTWIRIGLCTGFLLKFLEACRCLREGQLGETTTKRAQWDLVVSAAELVFNFSALCKASPPIVIFFTFIAKSLGVVSIICRPNVRYFERV